jgi:hypothetical protein
MTYEYKIIEKACDKIKRLLYKLPEAEQRAIMNEVYPMLWDSYDLQVRTDSPMNFCLDLMEGLKTEDMDNLPEYLIDIFPK